MMNFHNYPILTYLQSEENARMWLSDLYDQQFLVNKEKESYQKAPALMYAFSSGIEFFKQGKYAPILTQPMFFFYACSHFIKGLLICMDHTYPSSTKQLAHGISSRKKKKKQYAFLHDEIRVQRHGLLPIAASSLFQITLEAHKTYSMQHLLALIPDMQPIFSRHGKRYVDHVGSINHPVFTFSENLLDNYHVPIQGMIQKVQPYLSPVTKVESKKEEHVVYVQKPLTKSSSPFFTDYETNKLYLPNRRSLFTEIDELLIHYMILYNLSMISRYEFEWWGELIATKSTSDYPIIQHFLYVTAEKLPTMIHAYLENIIR